MLIIPLDDLGIVQASWELRDPAEVLLLLLDVVQLYTTSTNTTTHTIAVSEGLGGSRGSRGSRGSVFLPCSGRARRSPPNKRGTCFLSVMRALRLLMQIVPHLSKAGDIVPISSKFHLQGGVFSATLVYISRRGTEGPTAINANCPPFVEGR